MPEQKPEPASVSPKPLATEPAETKYAASDLRARSAATSSSNQVRGATQFLSESRIAGTGPVSSSLRVADLQDKVLGDFRLLRRIGGGGMAEVWLAEQTSLRRQVAIKVMRPDIQSDETCRKRFEQEALAAAGLNHPNIVQVYGVGEVDGIHFIAQEYVQGMNMRDFIAKKGPPPLNIALLVMKQVAAALQVAGEAGIVHRDIKPENILLTKKGLAKVVDFGLAQLTQGGDLRLTQQGMTMGTPLYMSPEQVQGNKVDHRSDLYSLGVTFYHFLSGRPPFRGETAFAVAYHQVHTDPPKLNAGRSDLPAVLCDLVLRMMAKNPEARVQTAHDLLQELRSIEKRVSKGLDLDSFAEAESARPGSIAEATKRRWLSFREWFDPRLHPRVAFVVCAMFVAVVSSGFGSRSVTNLAARTPPVEVRTPKQANVRDQLNRAFQLQTEDAFRAVMFWFREDSPEQYVARRELIRRLLPQLRLREVETLCREVRSAKDAPQPEVVMAWAAEATVLALDKKLSEADRIFSEQVKPYERSIPPEFTHGFHEAREQRVIQPDPPQGPPLNSGTGPDRGPPRRGNPERRADGRVNGSP